MSANAFPPESAKRPLPPRVARLGWGLLALGVLILVAAYVTDARRAAFDNVILLLFVASLAVGSVFLVALEHIVGAVWSTPMRRLIEFLAGLTPLLPLIGIPLLFQLSEVFLWTHSDALGADHALRGKSAYLNVPFFVARFAGVCLLWFIFFRLFTRNSLLQDRTADQKLTTRNIRLAAVFMPVFAVTITLTAIDWGMSLEPHWYSTIYGVYYFSGTALAAVAAATLVVVYLLDAGYLPGLRKDHLYSLGALMFAFVNFWAYIAFSQFLLIWYANLPEETFWFMHRWENGWLVVSILLIVVHFAVPYFALLPQEAKMNTKRLKFMAIWILFAHLLDVYWLVMPTFSESVTFGWQEIAVPLLATGMAITVLAWKMDRQNMVAVGDPKLARGMDFRMP